MRKNIQAFTLIELLVTITIIMILSSVAVIGLNSIRDKAQDASRLSSIRELQISLEAYKSVNGTYPEASTQGTATYITGLTPTFMTKLPVDRVQSETIGFHYAVSSDKKTYCVYVKGSVLKPEAQADLYSTTCPKTWVACKGTSVATLTTCPIN